jgi:NAD(P)-dependent dehydrogenase (short-subunit alcohol dehydrogenase family)
LNAVAREPAFHYTFYIALASVRSMTKASLGGQRALTTGAARGVGTAMAGVMTSRGTNVSLVGLDRGWASWQAFPRGSGQAPYGEQPENAVGVASFAYGGVDAVVAHAGAADRNPVAAESADAHSRTTEGNIGGLIRTGHVLLPQREWNQDFPYVAFSPTSLSDKPGMTCGRGARVSSAHPASFDTATARDTGDGFPASTARRREPSGDL